MAKKSAIPTVIGGFINWHDGFNLGVQAVGATVGLTAGEIAQVGTDNTALHTKADAQAAGVTASLLATSERDAVWKAADQRARKLAGRAKLSTAYTEAIGQQLKIIGADSFFDVANAKPTLTGTAQPDGVVHLEFSKEGSQGVNIYSQRDGDAAFPFLARDTTSPYVDNRPLLVPGKPEVRRYRCRYIVDDVEVGLPSDEIVVTAQPY